ncbi:MAG: YfhO family protein [Chloroflexi bacterium]|nr:YfhO family protein [Chloroflexota bacterium]
MKTLRPLSDVLKHLGAFLRRPSSLIFLGPFLLLSPVYLTGRAMFWGTPILQFVPWWDYAWTTLRAGELPLWNPLVGMGAPLLANYQSALIYPPNWVYFILHTLGDVPLMAWGIAPMVALHLAGAGWGMYKLVKEMGMNELSGTISGLALGLSGYLVARAHFLSITHAVAWLPWIMLVGYKLATKPSKQGLLKLTILMAMQLLAGHAQTTWYTFLLAFAWMTFWAWRSGSWQHIVKTWGRFVLAGGWAGLLAAIQLIPTAEYLTQSQRASAVDFEFALNYSFWPWRFFTLIAPNFFGSPASGDYWGAGAYWEDAVYIGLLPILFAVVALLRRGKGSEKRALGWFLFIITVISFVFALGKNTPIFPWLYTNVPTFDMFQAPARYLIWAVFALSLLAGMGVERWRRPENRALYWSRLGAAGAFAVTLGAGLGWLATSTAVVDLGEIRPTFISALALAGFTGLAVGILNLLAPPKGEGKQKWWQWAVSTVLLFDLLLMGWGLNAGVNLDAYETTAIPNVSEKRIFMDLDAEEEIKFERLFGFDSFQNEDPWELAGEVLLPNMNMLAGVASANNFDPLVPSRYARWMEVLNEDPDNQALLSRMAVERVFDETSGDYQRINYVDGYLSEGVRWVTCATAVGDEEDLLQKIFFTEAVDQHIYVESERVVPTCSQENVVVDFAIVSRTANSVTIECSSDEPGWLVLGDIDYPGWFATVDGEPVRIFQADFLFRGVIVPDGNHMVEFKYKPLSFELGAILSSIALITLVILSYNMRVNEEHEN